MNGILLLDKPGGVTSNGALQQAKSLYRARKAGHTGSLDRMASGLLPLCFGEATKFSSYLLNADKHYDATFRLGIRTATGDATGEVLETRAIPALDAGRVEAVFSRFRGEIEQVPPMYSAIKHEGRRLYELAYRGEEVARSPRKVTIYRLETTRCEGDELDVHVSCSKGTYIRTLAEDIGEMLGCGAHVAALRRTGSGPFRDTEMIGLEELGRIAEQDTAALDALLLNADAALRDSPVVELAESVAFYLRQGQPVIVPHAPTEGMVRIYDQGHRFLGVGEVLDDGRIAPRRLVSAA